MEQKKVRLPREVAEALYSAISNNKGDVLFIAYSSTDIDWCKKQGGYWKVLAEFVGRRPGLFQLIDALRYGYEVDPEPITVTITTEQQEKIRQTYEKCSFYEQNGFKTALMMAGIKIPGVND